MTEILLFHHIQGLTSGVHALADRLREAGHTVHTPDSFEGRTFGSIDEGAAYVGGIGFQEMRDRSVLHAEGLPNDLVYAGLSLGVMPAQTLLQNRPGARAGLFFHGFADPSFFGDWPGVPVQVHAMSDDEFWLEDREAAEAAAAKHDGIEIFTYPGSGHLFTDNTVADHDAAATDLVVERSLALLDRL
ncbi:MAG: dienelactone hydrolase family protein [Nocardioides sp.]